VIPHRRGNANRGLGLLWVDLPCPPVCFSSTGCWTPERRRGPGMKRGSFSSDQTAVRLVERSRKLPLPIPTTAHTTQPETPPADPPVASLPAAAHRGSPRRCPAPAASAAARGSCSRDRPPAGVRQPSTLPSLFLLNAISVRVLTLWQASGGFRAPLSRRQTLSASLGPSRRSSRPRPVLRHPWPLAGQE